MLRRSVVGAVLAVAIVGPGSSAEASPGPNSRKTIVAAWGDGTFVAKRFGWNVRVTVTTDEYLGEAACVYAKLTLDVSGGPDASADHVAEECNVDETTTKVVWLRPTDIGTAIRGLRISLCQPDFASDSCESTTMPVWQNLADRPGLLDRANVRLDESMANFISARRARVGPWDWGTDGCSGPAVRKAEFRTACLRHDFGYRNYGNGLTVAPFDEYRARIDARFLTDMNNICERKYDGDAEADCRTAATGNYVGVRHGGARAFFGQA